MLWLGVNAKLPSSTKHAAIVCLSSTMLETIDPCTSVLHKKLQKKKILDYDIYDITLHQILLQDCETMLLPACLLYSATDCY